MKVLTCLRTRPTAQGPMRSWDTCSQDWVRLWRRTWRRHNEDDDFRTMDMRKMLVVVTVMGLMTVILMMMTVVVRWRG